MIFGKKREALPRDKVIQFKKVFGTREGKELFSELNKRFWGTVTHKGGAFEEGQRSVVLYIKDMCETDLAEFDRLSEGD